MIVCKGELLTFRRNLNNPTENDIKVKLAFLMALSIIGMSPNRGEGAGDVHIAFGVDPVGVSVRVASSLHSIF